MVLPKPSGPHIVGCADIMTKVISLPRDITCKFSVIEKEVNFGTFARLYYPTEADSKAKFAEANILPNAEGSLYAESMFSMFKLKWLGRFGSFFLRSALQHSYIDAPLISQCQNNEATDQENKKFPLILLSHGLIGFRHIYSAFCCELASHGYIVAAVEHRDGSAMPTYFIHPDTKKATPVPYVDQPTNEKSDEEAFRFRSLQVNKRAEEISRLLDLVEVLNKEPEKIENLYPSNFDLTSLKERIDVKEPMIFGHSFGGATTLKSMNTDDRFKCGIVLDPWFLPLSSQEEFFEAGIKKPTFTIFTERFNWHQNIERCGRFNNGLPEGYPIKLLDGYKLPCEFFKGMRVFDHSSSNKTEEEVDNEECDEAKAKL